MKFACAAMTGCDSCTTWSEEMRGVVSWENAKLRILSSLYDGRALVRSLYLSIFSWHLGYGNLL